MTKKIPDLQYLTIDHLYKTLSLVNVNTYKKKVRPLANLVHCSSLGRCIMMDQGLGSQSGTISFSDLNVIKRLLVVDHNYFAHTSFENTLD